MDWQSYNTLSTIQKQLTALQKQVTLQSNALNALSNLVLSSLVEGKRTPTKLRLATDQSQLLNKHGVLIMSGALNCTDDHDMRVPLQWTDDVGSVAAPTSGTTAVSDNAAVISAIDVAADDMSIVLRTAADGTANITVSNGTLSDVIQVTVGPPSASHLNVDAADAVQVAKGTPA